jgi:PEP-CTERM motif-containing protein
MKATPFLRGTLFAAAVLLFCGPAQALDIPLNPSLNQTGFFNFTVCPPPACAGFDSGLITTTYTVTFATAGFFSSSIIPSIVDTSPPPSSFSVLNYSIKDPSMTTLFSGITSQSNLAVIAGTYTITVSYHFLGGPNASSAALTMPLTTGATVLKVPEPGTLALLGGALLILGVVSRRSLR